MNSKTRIVLADDHPIVLGGLRNLILAEPDLEVVGEAASGLAALKLIKEKQPDIAVIDVSMPECNGVVLARRIAEEYDKVYGVDFVNLGYKYGYVSVLKGMGLSIESIFPTDNSGTPLSELPMMDSIVNYEQIAFVFEVADNATADYWISIVNAGYGVPMGVGATAVMAPKYYAFVGSGQIVGLLGGMKGAAEYEILVDRPDAAFRGMDIQSLVHFLIIGFVILGNIGYFASRRYRRKESL